MAQSPQIPRRGRNASATRCAILVAARSAFARAGYEQVGVREIAAAVGVNVALVLRYFGSKEQLFATAVAEGFRLEGLLEGERSQLGELLARYVLQKDTDSADLAPLLTLLRSAHHPQAAEILRNSLHTQFVQPLTDWLGGEDAQLRAGLIAATLNGLVVTRAVIGLEPLASAEVEPLVALIGPVLQGYIDGTT